jgi:hypothetical protein
MTTEKKKVVKKVAPSKPTINPDAVAVVAALLMHKGAPTQAALENAKLIVEKANELVGE